MISTRHYHASATAPARSPDHLGARFDWMAVSHRRLFQMVRQGMDVEGAHAIADRWQRVSAGLSALGEDLAALETELADAWEGPAARGAAENVTALSSWTRHTADKAREVSECVTRQAELAAHARETMPPPAQPLPTDGLSPMPTAAGAPPPGPGQAFLGGFGTAEHVLVDHQIHADATREQHAQAARVMNQFQAASREVHQTVPRFARPDPPMTRRRPDRREPLRIGNRSDAGQTAASAVTGGGPVPGGFDPTGGSGGIAGGAGVAASPLGTPRPGARAGGDEARMAPRAPGGAPGSAGGAAAMPLGGKASGGDEDHEHRVPGYLENDLWSDLERDLRVSVPVIGADPRG